MEKIEVINSDTSHIIAQTGHLDKLSIGDAGMPVPRTTERTDLAVTNGVPSFMEVLNNALEESAVQRAYLAGEIRTEDPDMLAAIKTRLPGTSISFISHTEMRQESNNCHAFIQVGEMTLYVNILSESNVAF